MNYIESCKYRYRIVEHQDGFSIQYQRRTVNPELNSSWDYLGPVNYVTAKQAFDNIQSNIDMDNGKINVKPFNPQNTKVVDITNL